MNNFELIAARELFALSQSEISRLSGIPQRSWSNMENGKYGVNAQAVAFVRELLNQRAAVIRQIEQHQKALGGNGKLCLPYSVDAENLGGELALRAYQAAIRFFVFDGNVALIPFDSKAYRSFCDEFKKPDCLETLIIWAQAA